MKRLVGTLAFTTTALALLSAYLLIQLRDERAGAARASELRREQERQIEELEEERTELAGRLQALRRAALSERSESPVSPRVASEAAGASDASGEPLAGGPLRGGMAPANMPAISVEQHKLMALRGYGELLRELELSPQQRDALLDAIVAHQQRTESAFRGLPGGPMGTLPNGDAVRAKMQELGERHKSEIASAIGARKAGEFEALQKTLPMRMELRQVRDHLEAVGTPVSDEQRAKLLAIMKERQLERPAPSASGSMPEQGFDQYRQWRAEHGQRLLEGAAEVLSSEQLERLQEYEDMQSAAMRGFGASAVAHSPEDTE